MGVWLQTSAKFILCPNLKRSQVCFNQEITKSLLLTRKSDVFSVLDSVRKFDGRGYRGCALPWRGHESSRNRPTGWLCELWLACRPRMIWWHLQNPRPIWGFRGQLLYFVGNCSTSGKSVHLASCFWRFLVFFWRWRGLNFERANC